MNSRPSCSWSAPVDATVTATGGTVREFMPHQNHRSRRVGPDRISGEPVRPPLSTPGHGARHDNGVTGTPHAQD
ncbi:hypothetical protein [Streptomyces sp. NPDC057557]|uniref:hypothetical protein n=1 Tax=Streptomyces sp. NPDC057557 TaxID=3346167 RepID=UPI0036A51DA1